MFYWHEKDWNSLAARLQQLPHALLIQGPPGTGIEAFAFTLAEALMCERRTSQGWACGACQACNWFAQGNHPDFRLVQPESLDSTETGESAEGAEGGDAIAPVAKKEKKKSDQIRVEQIRALQDFLAIGTHRAGNRVVLVRPAEAMNVTTQNALLKSLEEPPPATVFILVTSHPARLLPTVRSRCQRIVLGQPDRQQALDWLLTQDPQQPLSLDDWDQLLAQCGGAPVAALQARQHEAARNGFVRLLRDGRPEVLAAADATQGLPPALLVGWLQRWVYDLLRARLGTPVRYHLAEAPLLAQLAARCDLIALTRLLRSLGDSLRLAEHPLNARLFAEDLFIRYREVFVVNALAGGPRRSSASSSASR